MVERWEREFRELEFPPEVVERVMPGDASRVLGIEV